VYCILMDRSSWKTRAAIGACAVLAAPATCEGVGFAEIEAGGVAVVIFPKRRNRLRGTVIVKREIVFISCGVCRCVSCA